MDESSTTSVASQPAYSVVDVEVRDAAAFEVYVQGHMPTLARYGGRFLVATNKVEVIEGEWIPKLIVIHQWPSVEAFHAWYDSDDYREWKELRFSAAIANVVLVEGITEG